MDGMRLGQSGVRPGSADKSAAGSYTCEAVVTQFRASCAVERNTPCFRLALRFATVAGLASRRAPSFARVASADSIRSRMSCVGIMVDVQ